MRISAHTHPVTFIPGGARPSNDIPKSPLPPTGKGEARRRLALTYPNVGGTTIAFLDQYEPQGTQTYHGLLLNLQRRAVRGVTIGGNYTWSHCITDFSASQSSGGGTPGTTYLDPNNRNFDRGNCDSDRRQLLNFTSVAQTPRFGNNTLRAAASGWRFSGIYRWSTGSYLTIRSGVD